jgi:quercetin dioxygenase-like cupin family protein
MTTRPGAQAPLTGTTPVVLSRVAGSGGVVWSVSPSGLHVNLVVLDPGGAIAEHRNDDIDVLLVVVEGAGTVSIDGAVTAVSSTTAVLAPAGATRSIAAGSEGLRYLTIHAERPPLSIVPRSERRNSERTS